MASFFVILCHTLLIGSDLKLTHPISSCVLYPIFVMESCLFPCHPMLSFTRRQWPNLCHPTLMGSGQSYDILRYFMSYFTHGKRPIFEYTISFMTHRKWPHPISSYTQKEWPHPESSFVILCRSLLKQVAHPILSHLMSSITHGKLPFSLSYYVIP